VDSVASDSWDAVGNSGNVASCVNHLSCLPILIGDDYIRVGRGREDQISDSRFDLVDVLFGPFNLRPWTSQASDHGATLP
jgi:hypothetical protein